MVVFSIISRFSSISNLFPESMAISSAYFPGAIQANVYLLVPPFLRRACRVSLPAGRFRISPSLAINARGVLPSANRALAHVPTRRRLGQCQRRRNSCETIRYRIHFDIQSSGSFPPPYPDTLAHPIPASRHVASQHAFLAPWRSIRLGALLSIFSAVP